MVEATPGAVTPETSGATIAPPAPDTTAVPGAQEAPPEPQAQEEKTLTQSEVDRIVQREKAKEARRAEKSAIERVRREMAEQEAARLRSQLEGRSATEPNGKPQASQYQNPEAFLDALADWKLDEREAKRQANAKRETDSSNAEEREQQRAQFVHEKIIGPGREKHEDFDDVVLAEGVPINDVMIAAAGKLENGVDVLYALASNRAEMTRVSRLSDIEQVWEIRDLGAKLKANPTPTKTPPPIKPNAGTSSPASGYRADMTDKQYAEWRGRQIAQRR